jgi:hypothetical protein
LALGLREITQRSPRLTVSALWGLLTTGLHGPKEVGPVLIWTLGFLTCTQYAYLKKIYIFLKYGDPFFKRLY